MELPQGKKAGEGKERKELSEWGCEPGALANSATTEQDRSWGKRNRFLTIRWMGAERGSEDTGLDWRDP